ncbi:MAG: alpha/beta fold hydrolase, partial [Litorimonas sp.]
MRLSHRLLSLGLAVLIGGVLTGCNAATEVAEPEASPYWSEQDRLVTLDGQTIRLRESGPRDAPPLILLHGFTDSLHGWDALVSELGEDFRILRPDLPGHGLSGPSPDDDYSNAALVDVVRALIAETDAEAPIL